MKITAKTPEEYLSKLPKERREDIQHLREVVLRNLPDGYEEGIQYNMISYHVPLSVYPEGYLGDKKTPLPYLSLASQKNHMALYISTIYYDKKLYKWFTEEYKKTGKRMDMGKSCVRFKKIEDLPLELIGKAVSRVEPPEFVKMYKEVRGKKV